VTGETLELNDCGAASTGNDHDPFVDPHSSSHSRPHSEYTHYSSGHTISQPPSNESHERLVGMPFSPVQVAYPQHVQGMPHVSHSVDHFLHDTEAYASGNYARANYRSPRSRSPTPFGDEEDYKLDTNNVVRYTGYSRTNSRYYDAENANASDIFNASYDVSEYVDNPENGHEDYAEKSLLPPEPETPIGTRHFGPAPIGRIRRRLKKKRVQLTNGNLVVDLNVPPKLVLPYRGEPEMTKTRYTAVTCDPDDFEKEKFFLRQNESGRTTELFIVITMYNVSLLTGIPTRNLNFVVGR
jgi:chitin synthase